MTVPNGAESIWRARFGCLRARDTMSCAGLVPRRRSSETIGVFTVRLDGRAPVVSGRGGRALRTSGRECVAQGRGLKGNRASHKAQRGTRTARGATDFLQSASLPASAGPAVLVQPESVRAELRLAVWRALFGSRGPRSSGFWAGRLRREGSRDELACPTRGQTNIGGQRMTGPQRRPARCEPHRRVASVSGARPGDALAGVPACLAGFHEVDRSGVVGRHRARRLGAVPPLLATSAARWGVRRGAWPTGA